MAGYNRPEDPAQYAEPQTFSGKAATMSMDSMRRHQSKLADDSLKEYNAKAQVILDKGKAELRACMNDVVKMWGAIFALGFGVGAVVGGTIMGVVWAIVT